MALHGPAVVPVEGCKGVLPAVQSLPQLLELIKAHSAGHVPLRRRSQSRTNHIPLQLVFLSLYHDHSMMLLIQQMSILM